ncbi:NAD(P)(+) transhydrogenase (Re/Si-specific) subunit beta, partial [Candidatus Sumerlaeota bacterium]|nr:NAD(P)(+) transhydrogenase (Re/Si-specific) subunit beta [Candidatus Sumerlaeota bacterium]
MTLFLQTTPTLAAAAEAVNEAAGQAAEAASGHPVETVFVNAAYLLAAALFILSLKWLSSPRTARQGVFAGEIGMLLAVVGALINHEIVSFQWILVGIVVGSAIGVPMAVFMPMTAVPQRTALSHAFGALAAALVGTAHFFTEGAHMTAMAMFFLIIEVLLGSLTFTGSLMAFGKLQEILPTHPITYKNQNIYNLSLLVVATLTGLLLVLNPGMSWLFPFFIIFAAGFGVMLILPIG